MRSGAFGVWLGVLVLAANSAPAHDEVFSDGFESADICAWSNADPADCPVCVVGEFSCSGNSILQCGAGPPASWNPTGTVCDPLTHKRCVAETGTCESLQVTGDATPTGTFYMYAYFSTSNSAFLGGCDVGSFGNRLYVNRGNWYENGMYLDVYQVELEDTDGDTALEPNQHPDNPNHTGPLEARQLTYVETHVIPELGLVHRSGIYPLEDRVYFVAGGVTPSTIYEYILDTGVTTTYAVGAPSIDNSFLGFGMADGLYYSGNEFGRVVFSLDPAIGDWVAEFEYPPMVSGHFDGLEVVVDPNTGTQYVYVSDMTSDFISQYRRDPVLGWVQENIFQNGGSGTYVEGMGFATFKHFWFTGDGTQLYEVGGGDLTKFLE